MGFTEMPRSKVKLSPKDIDEIFEGINVRKPPPGWTHEQYRKWLADRREGEKSRKAAIDRNKKRRIDDTGKKMQFK